MKRTFIETMGMNRKTFMHTPSVKTDLSDSPALEIIIFHYVYCTHQISDTIYMYTGNLDVYRLSHSHEIYLLQSKTKYMHMLMLYICFQTCSCIHSHIVSIEYWFFLNKAASAFHSTRKCQYAQTRQNQRMQPLCKNVRIGFWIKVSYGQQAWTGQNRTA